MVRILRETTEIQPQIETLQILDCVDMRSVEKELEEYNLELVWKPKRRHSKDLWLVPVECAVAINSEGRTSYARLFVDLKKRRAFAMPGHGNDKQELLLLSTTINKFIKEPFTLDPDIRLEV